MPLTKFQANATQSGQAIWHITESEEELSNSIIGSAPESLINPKKRLEWLAARHLLLTLCNHLGLRYFGIRKDEFGKPYLEKYPHHISLTHSYPYCAAQINHDNPVGIDLEQPREKLLVIAPRILSSTELNDAGNDVVKHCVLWSAKEAMFKIHGRGGLHFYNQLNVEPFLLQEEGTLNGTITDQEVQTKVKLGYEVTPDYVLVFSA